MDGVTIVIARWPVSQDFTRVIARRPASHDPYRSIIVWVREHKKGRGGEGNREDYRTGGEEDRDSEKQL